MPRITIIFDSVTGNTEKVACAVAEGAEKVKEVNVIVKRVGQATLGDLLESDGVIIGSPVYFGQMSAKMKAFIDKSIEVYGKLDGKVGAAFTSSGGKVSGAETTLLSIIHALLIHGMVVLGRSKGKHYGAASVESPDLEDLDDCRDLGHKVANLVMRLKK